MNEAMEGREDEWTSISCHSLQRWTTKGCTVSNGRAGARGSLETGPGGIPRMLGTHGQGGEGSFSFHRRPPTATAPFRKAQHLTRASTPAPLRLAQIYLVST